MPGEPVQGYSTRNRPVWGEYPDRACFLLINSKILLSFRFELIDLREVPTRVRQVCVLFALFRRGFHRNRSFRRLARLTIIAPASRAARQSLDAAASSSSARESGVDCWLIETVREVRRQPRFGPESELHPSISWGARRRSHRDPGCRPGPRSGLLLGGRVRPLVPGEPS